jgi:hypothetical protein
VIDRYAVVANGSVTHTTQELTPEQIVQLDADNWKATFGIGNEVKPAISKVLLAEYANNHAVQWRSYKTDLGVTEQNQDPADVSAIAANNGFTLQAAKQLFKDGTARPIEDAETIRLYNGGHYITWDRSAHAWKFMATNKYGFNYVDRVCKEVEP